MRRAVRIAILLGVAVLASPGAATAAKHAKRVFCKNVRAGVEFSTSRVRIARTAGSDEGYSLVGCLLPYGRLRRLASENESDDVNTELVQIGPAHGTWVEITAGEDNQYGSTTAVVLRNVATGEGYEVNTERSTIGEYPADILSRLIFDSHGHAITALIPQGSMPPDPAKDTEAISVYTGDGTQIVLDSGPRPDVPPESLSLNGGVAAWTHSGVRRSVMFAG